MTTFTINIEDKKSEKVLKAILNALEIDYKLESIDEIAQQSRPLNKKEKQIFESLKGSLTDIKKWEKGELELKSARDLLNEL